MTGNPFSLWVYLSQTPLLWLTVTLLVYAAADAISQATHRSPLANPVLHSVWVIGAILLLTGTPYPNYFDGAQFVHFLLGPATVALAVPLYENRSTVLSAVLPMLIALVVGSLTAIVSIVLLAEAVGLPRDIVVSLAPKSITAGVAMGVSESMGANPSITAIAVILTGIMGAIVVTPLMNGMKVTDFRARDCGRPRFARHRDGAGVPGRYRCGRIRRRRHEPECAADLARGTGADRLAGSVVERLSRNRVGRTGVVDRYISNC